MGYLTIHCLDKSCRAIYRAYRLSPSNTITYCMYCASKHITVSQDTELDILETLAKEYNSTPEVIKAMLQTYSPASKHTFHFIMTGKP